VAYRDLREFLAVRLEREGELKRPLCEVDVDLEITEITDEFEGRGPALLFERPAPPARRELHPTVAHAICWGAGGAWNWRSMLLSRRGGAAHRGSAEMKPPEGSSTK